VATYEPRDVDCAKFMNRPALPSLSVCDLETQKAARCDLWSERSRRVDPHISCKPLHPEPSRRPSMAVLQIWRRDLDMLD